MRRVDWELLLVGAPSLVQVTEVGEEEVERTANEKLGGLWERLVSSWKATGGTTTGPPSGEGGGGRGGGGAGTHSTTTDGCDNLRDDWIVAEAYRPANRICSTPFSSGMRHVKTPSTPPPVLKRLIFDGFLSA